MNVFELRRRVIDDYAAYIRSFISIRDPRIEEEAAKALTEGLLWPDPRIALNPAFAPGAWIDDLVNAGVLHPECAPIFRLKGDAHAAGQPLRLHRHQVDAIEAARAGRNYVLTTGTGSGKSLAYIVPIVDQILRGDRRKGVKAIVVYPMNALANSQEQELTKFLSHGYPDGRGPVTFRRYTGQDPDEKRREIWADPPDIILTNYVMLELILTRDEERPLVAAARDLRFLVLDELHTYRGRQGADVALLVRRARDAFAARSLQHVGTSATMATGGTFAEQRAEIARVASLIFGAPVGPEDVIGETLRRVTPEADGSAFDAALAQRVGDPAAEPPATFEAFVADPLSSWIEGAFGLATEAESGRLARATPRAITGEKGGAAELSRLTGVAAERCAEQIQRQLLAGYAIKHPETGFPVFAFRLHQFISRGETVFASLEPEEERYVTVYPQKCVPDDRSRPLFPLAFCRACGQEYYRVHLVKDPAVGERIEARGLDEREALPGGAPAEPGYLYLNTANPWVDSVENLPDDWLEMDGARVKHHFRALAPKGKRVNPDGRVVLAQGVAAHFVPTPFRFCLRCQVTYGGRSRSDFSKLSTLGSEGRSTATTILTLSAVRHLRRDGDLIPEARKLLSFTDNRQDASLQAGHFNDFVEVGLLRSALVRATARAGPEGISHESLTQRVFEALDLPFELYAADPEARYGVAKAETERALRDVLGYRLYCDLERGWRITSPNLEQAGLLRMEYVSLDELAAKEEAWAPCHAALAGAAPETRAAVARVLLDFLRRGLAINVDYLDVIFQERLQQRSSQKLRAPWALDESETTLTHAALAVPRSSRPHEYGGWLYLSPRGGFGQYLGRRATFPHLAVPLNTADREVVLRDLLEALRTFGLVAPAPGGPDDVTAYQVPAAAMRWVAGDGTQVGHDPIRVPNPSREGGRPNAFFLDFYREIATEGHGLEAREHTAAVPYEAREEREQRFRSGALPILFCSPTMELGVDIASLNVVNMRNVPPTPANYAQRSGRAGRSGQPALVITYCSGGSSHDQYFFHRPERMVSGQVNPPRLDLANEDLVRAHVHALWLAETGVSLGRSLTDVLNVSGEPPSLDLQSWIRDVIEDPAPRQQAKRRAQEILGTFSDELETAAWWSPTWLDDTFRTVARRFEGACDRWRSLYRSAWTQQQFQNRIIVDAARTPADRNEAKRYRREAEAQLVLLAASVAQASQSDFYSYRYFASEGFLPGYSFPRLPLSAFIPGRARAADEYLSRPRFLAISEFGPRNFIYHEGSRYIIDRVILPIAPDPTGEQTLTTAAKVCRTCGYLHPLADPAGPDRCENCGIELEAPMRQLFRLQNVTTRRRDRINSDEEERQRQGYTIRSSIRFSESDGRLAKQTATVEANGSALAALSYGHAATIWRINLGWSRSSAMAGFLLDVEKGRWETGPLDDPDDPLGPRRERVVPFVEDHRNCLLFQPAGEMGEELMASLQAALKTAIQVEFQLEDSELAAEPLPSPDDRRFLLFYEAAEGGAGVLRRLVEDETALGRVARTALDLCHFDPETGVDRGKPPWRSEPCSAACYDCLMSYSNQPEHRLLDRQLVAPFLLSLAGAQVAIAPGALTRDAQLERLERLAGSGLERKWLRFLMEKGYRLPTDAQKLVEAAGTRPDFTYADHYLAVYVDGPPHDYPERRKRDVQSQEAMANLGYVVVRFHHQDDWEAILGQHPDVFGSPS